MSSTTRLQLRVQGEESTSSVLDLDEDLRSGAVPHTAEVLHPAWGETWTPVMAVPALADALADPRARFARGLREGRRPWTISAVAATLVGVATWQAVAAPLSGPDAVRQVAMGLGPTVLDGRWWTVWTAHLVHAPGMELIHLGMNLPLLLYCGWRVERAWAWHGLLAILAGSAAGAGLLTSLASAAPVVGSSTLVYGVWGAQMATGWRMEHAIPVGYRGPYAWGNLLLFVPLFVLGLLSPGPVSHLGHVGGLFGGILATLLLRLDVLQGRTGRGDLARFAGISVGSALTVVALARWPAWVEAPVGVVEVQGTGVHLPLAGVGWERDLVFTSDTRWAPDRLAPGWLMVQRLEATDHATARAFDAPARWERQLDVTASPLPDPPEPLGPGWAVEGWRLHGEDGAVVAEVVEHHLVRGIDLVRVVEHYGDAGAGRLGARGALFRSLLTRIEVDDPKALVRAREAWSRNPEEPQARYDYAVVAHRVGAPPTVEELLAPLHAREDGWQWDAARLRLAHFDAYPELDATAEVAWVLPFLAEAPAHDLALHQPALRWLFRRRACDEGRAHLETFRGRAEAWMVEYADSARSVRRLQEALASLDIEADEACGVAQEAPVEVP